MEVSIVTSVCKSFLGGLHTLFLVSLCLHIGSLNMESILTLNIFLGRILNFHQCDCNKPFDCINRRLHWDGLSLLG